MDKKTFSFFTSVIFSVILLFIFSNFAFADVIVYDDVTTAGKPVKLKALTKGKFFPEGGKLVEFYVDEKHIGTTLSGGDGYAFLEYLSHTIGTKTIKVKKDSEMDKGILLVTGKKDKVLLIEIENTLFKFKFQDLLQHAVSAKRFDVKLLSESTKESKDALKRLFKKFKVIYLTTMLGVKQSKKWLKDNHFPPSTVLKWEGSDMLGELQERKVKLYAIIGSPDILSEASDIKKRFSFEETEDAVVVKGWDELLKQLE